MTKLIAPNSPLCWDWVYVFTAQVQESQLMFGFALLENGTRGM